MNPLFGTRKPADYSCYQLALDKSIKEQEERQELLYELQQLELIAKHSGLELDFLLSKRHIPSRTKDGLSIYDQKTKETAYYKQGLLHRDDGPAVEGINKVWFVNGKRHREDGPAVDTPTYKAWYQDEILIREEH